jgi:hypothetical protein
MLTALAMAATLLVSHPSSPVTEATLRVRVDSTHHTVVLTSGRYDLPAASGTGHVGMGEMAGMTMVLSKVMRFTFPIDGWLRGARLRITDQSGKALSRRVIHHINVINFSRRQLFYPIPELIVAMGQETEDIRLPASVGVPVSATMPMALVIMFDNDTPQEIKGVTVELTVEYSPANLAPRPLDVLPGYMDVVYPVARDVDFDLPPGATKHTAEFKMPLNGRIIGAGGHAHAYATGISLFDVTNGTPKPVVQLKTPQAADGHLLGVERILPGISGSGIRLQEGRLYRLVGSYNNPTGKTLVNGAMVHLVLVFAPDRMADWPKVDPNNPDWKRELAFMEARWTGAGDMTGMKMDH